MKQDVCGTSILVGNKGKDVKKAALLTAVCAMLFTCIISTGISSFLQLSFVASCGMIFSVFLLSFLSFSSFLSTNVRYFEIMEHEIVIADSTQFQVQNKMLLNALFKTHYEVETARFQFTNIQAVKIYAIEDTRYTRFTQYDGNMDKGYRVWIKLYLSDQSSFILKDWFYYKNPNIVPAFAYLKKNGIEIIDQQHILDIIKKSLSLNDVLNEKVSL